MLTVPVRRDHAVNFREIFLNIPKRGFKRRAFAAVNLVFQQGNVIVFGWKKVLMLTVTAVIDNYNIAKARIQHILYGLSEFLIGI